MQRSVLLLITLVSFLFTKAQFKTIAESQSIDFSESANLRVLQMRGGSTMLFNFSPKGGLVVRLYNSDHKAAPEVKIDKLQYEKFDRSTNVHAIFEIAGDAVLFVSRLQNKSRSLYRIIIDGKTGNLKEDKMIGSREEFGRANNEGSSAGDVSNGFYIKKDPYSDNYVVVYLRTYESDRNKVIEECHYGSDNKIISQAFVNSPDDAYKHLEFQDAVVLGKEKVCLLVFGINTKANGGKRTELFLSTFDAGATQQALVRFDVTKDFKSITGHLKYNAATKKLISILTLTEDGKGGSTVPYLAFIDPVQKKLDRFDQAYPLAAASKSIDMYGEKKGVMGLPQNIYIHPNGGFSVMFEQTSQQGIIYSSGGTVSYDVRGNFAFSNYDSAGTLLGSYLLPKLHSMDAHTMMTFGFEQSDKYKQSFYVNSGQNSYIVFNDFFENEQLVQNNSTPKVVDNQAPIDGFSFAISGKDVILKRNYIFGQPNADLHTQGLFEISDYNMDNNIFVTVKCQKQDKKKGIQLVWLQPA